MASKPAIRLLASTNNARGDLFTRLVKDLFFALGYDELRLDVAKSGREIDLRGCHRFEPRDVIAECKAEQEPIGGADANKFLGVLTRERDRAGDRPIAGYFVSLSGFRESLVEQEKQTTEKNRIILLTGEQVVEALVRSGLLLSRDEAVERAGRCAEAAGLDAKLDGTELLGHSLGYVWAVYYASGKTRTHVVFIHADGTPLAEKVAKQIVKSDQDGLNKLEVISAPTSKRAAVLKKANERYLKWLEEECGFIQLDGLPADTDLSATRMKLERLFVPLNVTIATEKTDAKEKPEENVVAVGELLGSKQRLALVAKPGGGKSTLLKRLAIAYGFPERRTQSNDHLPGRKWLPLFVRCRELRDRIHRPIVELLDDLPLHAAMNEAETSAFRERIHESLRSGEALLLVDGLDEISDEGARQTFAKHLRTFIGMFPNAALVVTSREAGFRLIAGVIAGVCNLARIASFNQNDVTRLCESWHVEVLKDSEKVRSDARKLAETIWENERIRALAENPLMLTTLLVVRRSIGELPTRRAELYSEAVKVLIRTWNTEGFEPLDLKEALAQLSYVACAMTEAGQQQIAQQPLLKLLRQARDELREELQFTQTSPEHFVERIEYRSSLLMQTGHVRRDGELQPLYEFRHLTFQEYLTARGLVFEQYPDRNEGRPLVDLLAPHLEDERWREIIPLAAVLAERKADPLIQRLITESQNQRGVYEGKLWYAPLYQCLLDEVHVSISTLRAAFAEIARDTDEYSPLEELHRGKFGSLLEQVVETAYLSGQEGWEEYVAAYCILFARDQNDLDEGLSLSLESSLLANNPSEQIRAALTCLNIAFRFKTIYEVDDIRAERFRRLRDTLGALVGLSDLRVALAATWALVWFGNSRLPNAPPAPEVLRSLLRLATEKTGVISTYAARAFSAQPLLPREVFAVEELPGNNSIGEHVHFARFAIVHTWYRLGNLSEELLEQASTFPNMTILEILRHIGPAGQSALMTALQIRSYFGPERYLSLYRDLAPD